MSHTFNYIVPIFNKEDVLPLTLEGIENCSSSDSKIILVVDGCTDRSEQIVDEFIKKYKDALPNIKDGKTLISHLQTVSNRNTGTTKQFADLIIKLSKSNKGLEKLLNNPNLLSSSYLN